MLSHVICVMKLLSNNIAEPKILKPLRITGLMYGIRYIEKIERYKMQFRETVCKTS